MTKIGLGCNLISDHTTITRRGSWGGVSPFKMHHFKALMHQSITGRPALGEILYPLPITIMCRYVNTLQTNDGVCRMGMVTECPLQLQQNFKVMFDLRR